MPKSRPPGDSQRFDLLFDEHHEAISRYCLRRLGTTDGEDAAADVFAIAWRRLPEVPVDDLRAWLFGIAYHVVGNYYRHRRRRGRLWERLVQERATVDAKPAISLDTELLLVALEALRAKDRELLRLASWDALSRREIATVLGINENAVDQRLHRARLRLKERFESLRNAQPLTDRKEASA